MSEFKKKLQKIIETSKIDFEVESPGFMIKTPNTEFNSNNKTAMFSPQEPSITINYIPRSSINSINEEKEINNQNYQPKVIKPSLFRQNKTFPMKSTINTIKRRIIPMNLNDNAFSFCEKNNDFSNFERIEFEHKNNNSAKILNRKKNMIEESKYISEIINDDEEKKYNFSINNHKKNFSFYNNENNAKKGNIYSTYTVKSVFQPEKKYFEKSRNNKLQNKILSMKQEFMDHSSQHTIINRPIRTLSSALYQFNRDSLNYISPLIRINKRTQIKDEINKQNSLNKKLKKDFCYVPKPIEKKEKKVIYFPNKKTIRCIWKNNNRDKFFD